MLHNCGGQNKQKVAVWVQGQGCVCKYSQHTHAHTLNSFMVCVCVFERDGEIKDASRVSVVPTIAPRHVPLSGKITIDVYHVRSINVQRCTIYNNKSYGTEARWKYDLLMIQRPDLCSCRLTPCARHAPTFRRGAYHVQCWATALLYGCAFSCVSFRALTLSPYCHPPWLRPSKVNKQKGLPVCGYNPYHLRDIHKNRKKNPIQSLASNLDGYNGQGGYC